MMKRDYRYIYSTLALCLLCMIHSSCKKDMMIEDPNLTVTVQNTTVAAGKPVTFSFTGTADIISFYSGEAGKEYKFRDRFSVKGKPELKFSSLRQFGTNTPDADTTLKVLISKDFKNVMDAENVLGATWTDITSRAALSTATAGQTTYTPSGTIDLSDFYEEDGTIFLAFRYRDFKSAVSQRTWTINNVSISNLLADGSSVSLATSANLSWGALNLAGTQGWTFSATQIQMSGGAANTADNIDWIISKPIQLDRVQRAFGVNIKTNPIAKQTEYTYTYNTPGTYTVTFDAINANKTGAKNKVTEITITVQ